MRIIQTKKPNELLEFIETKTFKNLPSELWDEKLPFYNKLLRLMSLSVDDELFNQILMYKTNIDNKASSVAIFDVVEKTLYYIGDTDMEIKKLIAYLRTNHLFVDKVNVYNDYIAKTLLNEPNFTLYFGDKKLYGNKKLNSIQQNEQISIKEITVENYALLWDGVQEAMEEGWRYFGGFIDNDLKSHAGLVRISKYRSEIVAVKTILASDRNKGYASHLCNYLIEKALNNTNIVTWTCTYNNTASFETAQKIGMNHYISIYGFNYSESNNTIKVD